MSERWAVHVDVEGFGAKWDDTADAFRGLNALMLGIFRIGSFAYPEPPDRLFAHQFGDGFLVVSDFPEESLDRAVLVSVALLRFVLAQGAIAKAAIAEGELSGITGCYPTEVREVSEDGRVELGAGLMTVFPVMGTALINSVGADKKTPSGPFLAIPANLASRISLNIDQETLGEDLVSLNWLQGELAGLSALQSSARLGTYSSADRVQQLKSYMSKNSGLSDSWKSNAIKYLVPNGI